MTLTYELKLQDLVKIKGCLKKYQIKSRLHLFNHEINGLKNFIKRGWETVIFRSIEQVSRTKEHLLKENEKWEKNDEDNRMENELLIFDCKKQYLIDPTHLPYELNDRYDSKHFHIRNNSYSELIDQYRGQKRFHYRY
ncbi:MAG: hypothetical protein OXE77_03045 [Flavobacteriaceae bacterium]|nr:hypothetical protein [Flavobacteriaceae bacterium]MCY4266371.1 hypothetical protein [Flavobacteriaceae bacterium]MCY4298590.1 hypothetical protein [Flavobacteriaceae bacterium]